MNYNYQLENINNPFSMYTFSVSISIKKFDQSMNVRKSQNWFYPREINWINSGREKKKKKSNNRYGNIIPFWMEWKKTPDFWFFSQITKA